jgi:preprotein translocase subunit SecA
LIGSESVDASEKISRILRQNKIDHTVLNAKYHAQEAEIIAQAGRRGAVTVATNMAGRGTDIKLEPGIAEIGGLHVVSTTRNTARRLDLQLKGRSARQGDKGSSKFFLSFEDSLMRLFSSPRLTAALQRFRLAENEGMSANILNKAIATAQKRIEGKNYTIRKYTLDYDDVMNKQRQEVYNFRNEILHTDDPLALARNLLTQVSQSLADKYLQSRSGYWDPEGFRQELITLFPVTFEEKEFDGDHISSEECAQKAANRLIEVFEHKYAYEISKHRASSTEVEANRLGEQAIRTVLLHRVDKLWQEHLLMMDHLRTEVSLRTLAQRDPLVEFKHEAFELFHRLTGTLYLDAARNLFKFEISSFHPVMFQSLLDQIHLQAQRKMMEPFSPPPAERENTSGSNGFTMPQNGVPKVNRNEACPCNSGKKYKKCCGLSEG